MSIIERAEKLIIMISALLGRLGRAPTFLVPITNPPFADTAGTVAQSVALFCTALYRQCRQAKRYEKTDSLLGERNSPNLLAE